MKIRLNPHRHCAGFWFTGGSSTSTTSQVSAPTAASEGSIAIGQGGRFVEGTDVSGSTGAHLGTTEISGGGGGVNIETSDPEVLMQALERVGQLSSQFSSTLGDVAKETNIAQSDQLATLLGALGELQAKTDTEGKTNKIILYAVLGVLVLLGVIFWPRRK
jgi:hypothetical protein